MLVSDKDVSDFETDGAACLRGVIPLDRIEQLRAGVEAALTNPGPYSSVQSDSDDPGYFYTEYFLWRRIPAFREFALESRMGEIAAGLLRSKEVRYFYDGLFVKEPGTLKPSLWHQDQPYYPVDGRLVVIWTPLDPVDEHTSLRIVRGSHQWGAWFLPVLFKDDRDMARESSRYKSLPDVDAEPDRYPTISWAVEPGDCVAFHGFALHGARGNHGTDRRRAFSSTWLGDDAVYSPRPGELEPHFHYLSGNTAGAPLTSDDLFPRVWPRK